MDWKIRKQAEIALGNSLYKHAEALDLGFTVIDTCIDRLSIKVSPEAKVISLVAAKGKCLSIACYSLALDGLAQESGAVLRVLLESVELLEYLQGDLTRIERAIEGSLPSAGEIAKAIDGKFYDLRKLLNDSASHVSVDYQSMLHLVDFRLGQVRKELIFDEKTLGVNLGTLAVFILGLAVWANVCTNKIMKETDQDVTDRLSKLHRSIEIVHRLESRGV